jgi:putative membrane protein
MAVDNAAMGGNGEPGTRGTHVSEHLANERTYLSYLRTSVSLMSFGIAINRFSLFLVQSNAGPSNPPLASRLVSSERLGVGMVVLGMALLVWATVHYWILLRQIERGDFRPRPGAVMVLTVLVLVCGLTGVVWLFLG